MLTLPDLTLIQYEALLKSDNCSDDTQRRAMMVAKSMYFSARMEAVGSTGSNGSKFIQIFSGVEGGQPNRSRLYVAEDHRY